MNVFFAFGMGILVLLATMTVLWHSGQGRLPASFAEESLQARITCQDKNLKELGQFDVRFKKSDLVFTSNGHVVGFTITGKKLERVGTCDTHDLAFKEAGEITLRCAAGVVEYQKNLCQK